MSLEAFTPATKVPVSIIIPTLNEGKNLARCLDHLRWADEVVIIDSNSTDDTVPIARAYGAGVIPFRWNGQWPKKRNWALRNAQLKHDWILMVDADEWIIPELAEEIREVIINPRFIGYWINRRFIFMGRWIKHCGYYPSWNLRLLKRGHGEFEKLTDVGDTGSGDNEVHEHIRPDGPTGYLKNDMLHLAFPTINIFIEKHNRYSNWEAIVQFKGSKEPSRGLPENPDVARRRQLKKISRKLPFRSTLRFLYTYIYKAGFLDGRAGYILCRLISIYEFLSWAKYQELRHEEEDRQVERTLSAIPAFDWKAVSPVAPTPEHINTGSQI